VEGKENTATGVLFTLCVACLILVVASLARCSEVSKDLAVCKTKMEALTNE
jgi:hypothetical protein